MHAKDKIVARVYLTIALFLYSDWVLITFPTVALTAKANHRFVLYSLFYILKWNQEDQCSLGSE